MPSKSKLAQARLEGLYKQAMADKQRMADKQKQADKPKESGHHFDTTPPPPKIVWVEDIIAVAAPPDYDYGKNYKMIKGKKIDCLYPNAVYLNPWANLWCVHIQGHGFNLAFDGALQQDIIYFKTEADALYAAAVTFKDLAEQPDWMAFNNWPKPYLAPKVKALLTQRLTNDGFVLALDSYIRVKGVNNGDDSNKL